MQGKLDRIQGQPCKQALNLWEIVDNFIRAFFVASEMIVQFLTLGTLHSLLTGKEQSPNFS